MAPDVDPRAPTARTRPKGRADAIVAAAARLFAERGFYAVGIDDIGEAVGITGPAVYHHFDSKEALLDAAARRAVGRVRAAYHDVAVAGSGAPAIESLVAGLVGLVVAEPETFTVYIRETRHLPEEPRKELLAEQRRHRLLWADALRALRSDLSADHIDLIVQSVAPIPASVSYYQPRLSRSRVIRLLTDFGVAAVGSAVAAASVGVPARRRRRPGVAPGALYVAKRASRREMALAAACQLFYERGYSGVGIADIAEAAGIAAPGLYRHFANKEDILVVAMNRTFEELATVISRALAASASPSDVLDRLVEDYLDFVVRNKPVLSVYANVANVLSNEHRETLRRLTRIYVDDWVMVLRDVRSDIPQEEGRLRVRAALALLNGSGLFRTTLPPVEARSVMTTMARACLLENKQRSA